MGVVREPSLFRCAIGYGAVYDLTAEAHRGDLTRPDRTRMDRALGTDVAKLRALSPLHNARSIDVPVLLIHGKHDLNVDYRQFERMQRALKREQKKVESLTLPREGSTAYDEEARREVYERVLQFLADGLNNAAMVSR
jgi:dipeptidyl aminopeptidase/acylaminoacyl peptidase